MEISGESTGIVLVSNVSWPEDEIGIRPTGIFRAFMVDYRMNSEIRRRQDETVDNHGW